jgi:hypothetical protein
MHKGHLPEGLDIASGVDLPETLTAVKQAGGTCYHCCHGGGWGRAALKERVLDADDMGPRL